jgi:hypothetical protein
MIAVAVVAVALGWHLHVARVERSLQQDRQRFMAWLSRFEFGNPEYQIVDLKRTLFVGPSPDRLPIKRGERGSWSWAFRAPDGRLVSIEVTLRATLLGKERRVTFHSPGGGVIWPFEDIERDRQADPAEVFPTAARR